MTTPKPHQLTTPVGRYIGGSIYEPRTTDYDGKPLQVKTGANAGKPRVDYNFGVAIPKTPGCGHWANEGWGAPIWALAHAAFPNGECQRPDFAWKITDGDSTIPNKRMKKPCDNEGYKGHWVIWFSGGQQPRVYNRDGTQQLLDKDIVKPGYFIQVFGSVTDNKPSASPGLYFNHSMIAFSGIGEEIQFGPDVTQAGFGQGVTLPPGATAYTGQPVPPAAGVPATGAALPPPPAAPLPPSGSAPAAPPPAQTAVAPPPPTVTPNSDIRTVPAKKMTASAIAPYDAYIAQGWTDAMLIANGLMTA